MLKELITKRDEELNQVNFQKKNLSELKSLAESINSKHLVFAKGLASVYESILFRSKLSYPFKFAQLVKYEKLMKNKKQYCLSKALDLFDQNFKFIKNHEGQISIDVLSSDLIFIYRDVYAEGWVKNQIYLGVLNHSGEIIHSKSILKQDKQFLRYKFKVNATNIIALNEIDSIVEIFNFKLELVHYIKLDRSCDQLKLNNYEICFVKAHYVFNKDSHEKSYSASFIHAAMNKLTITRYNYQTVHVTKNKAEICLDKNGFEAVEEKFFKFVGVNDRFFFIGGKCEKDSDHSTIICLLNREDENKIYKSFKCTTDDLFFYNAEFCARFYYFDDEDKFRTSINVYDKDNNDSGEPSAIVKGVEYENEILFVGESRNEKRNYSYYKYIYSRHIFASSYKQY